MSATDPPRSAVPATLPRDLVVLAVGLAVVAAGARLVWFGVHDGTLVRWECFAGTCATNDLAGAAPVLGGVCLVLGGLLAAKTLRAVAPPAVVAVAAVSALLGWRGAVDDHLTTAEAVRVPVLVSGAVAVVAVLWTVMATVRELRRSAVLSVLGGRTGTWARVSDYENIDGVRCRATVHFDDADGVRWSVRAEVPRDAFKRPPRVYYDPAAPQDPGRLRIGVPSAALTAAGRAAREQAVRVMLPLPSDDHPSGRPAATGGTDGTEGTEGTGGTKVTEGTARGSGAGRPGVVDQLERLRDLHAQGAIDDREYARAKSAVLGG